MTPDTTRSPSVIPNAVRDLQFSLRLADPADAPLLSRVGATLFAQAFASSNTPENLNAYLATAFNETQQRRELSDPNNLIWIAESDGGDAIGYTHLKLDSATSVQALERPAELSRIYADQRWHGAGVGQRLLAQCIETARAHDRSHLWLGVFQQNARAIAFYRKHGFEIVGEQIFVVGSDPQADWVMVRPLG